MIQISETKRTKGKLNSDYTLKHTYPLYKKRIEKKLQVDIKTYLSVNKDFIKRIREEILLHDFEYKLPCRLGGHRIRKRKTNLAYLNNLRVDWEATKKYKKIIKHTNDHRNGYYYRWIWYKEGPVKNKAFYSFIACRENTRLLATLLKTYKMSKLDFRE